MLYEGRATPGRQRAQGRGGRGARLAWPLSDEIHWAGATGAPRLPAPLIPGGINWIVENLFAVTQNN